MEDLMNKSELSRMIDHTILKTSASEDDVIRLCKEAVENDFASVCINPVYVPLAAKQLKGKNPKVCTVIGFPLGATPSEVKAFETSWAVEKGAQEIDMVLAVGQLKSGNLDYVEKDIQAVVQASKNSSVKVILETCFLNNDEIETACRLCEKAGADYVKTSTGFGSGGATTEDVALMHKTVPGLKVKASGGIRDTQAALNMVEAGASRLGTSSGIAIVEGL